MTHKKLDEEAGIKKRNEVALHINSQLYAKRLLIDDYGRDVGVEFNWQGPKVLIPGINVPI